MSVYFSPNGGAKEALIALIGSAKVNCYVAIYGFNDMDIAEALINAQARRVDVKVIMDKMQTFGKQATLHDVLASTGMPVYVYHPPSGIMHNKFTLVDDVAVATGSFNYTDQATNHNKENMIVLSDGGSTEDAWIGTLIVQYYGEFTKILLAAEEENPANPVTKLKRFLRGFPYLSPDV